MTIGEIGILSGLGINLLVMLAKKITGDAKRDSQHKENRDASRRLQRNLLIIGRQIDKRIDSVDGRLSTLNGTVAKHVTALALQGQAIEEVRKDVEELKEQGGT